MKKQIIKLSLIGIFSLLAAGGAAAQADGKMKMGDMDMQAMHQSPHHLVVTAYRHNALVFTRTLWEMSSDGNIENVALARTAFSEIKSSMEKIDAIHKMHMASMSKMDAAAMEKMKPMMQKMESEKALMTSHMMQLDRALQAAAPDAQAVAMHTAFLFLKLQKMNAPMRSPGH